MSSMSPKVQNQIQQLQQVQQQLQTILSQKAQFEIEIRETRRASEELADLPEDATVFLSVGTVMMLKPKETVSSRLNERSRPGLRVKPTGDRNRYFRAGSRRSRGDQGARGEKPPLGRITSIFRHRPFRCRPPAKAG